MRRAILALTLLAMVLASGSGCYWTRPNVINRYRQSGCYECLSARLRRDQAPQGPPTETYGYPYYTTRAPRDFLTNNPPSIGR